MRLARILAFLKNEKEVFKIVDSLVILRSYAPPNRYASRDPFRVRATELAIRHSCVG